MRLALHLVDRRSIWSFNSFLRIRELHYNRHKLAATAKRLPIAIVEITLQIRDSVDALAPDRGALTVAPDETIRFRLNMPLSLLHYSRCSL
ncbi:hypothetical protein [Nostoc sp.]|uniref:hypothetical protein n=1 Tax=Nostoc sp. TaxID=1180 RepID=UPI002FFACE17